jgi:Ca-activated chloride channel family protein
VLLFSLCALLAGLADDGARFRSDSQVVLVPVTVTDRRGALVTGLNAGAFTLMQDNVPQKITSFGEEDIPASIGVVFDTSGSMRTALPQAKAVLRAFFDQCNPEDEAFLYTVSSRPEIDSPYTADFGNLLSHAAFFEAKGSTALADTIFAALRKSRSGHHSRKALLVISDGMDNHSRYSKAELLSAAMEADLQIYSISVFDPPRNKKAIELQEERQGTFFLEELSRKTGGLQIVVQNEHDIEAAAAQVGKAIRSQYVIGFVPEGVHSDEKWHAIRVKTNLPNTTAWFRSGFVAATR